MRLADLLPGAGSPIAFYPKLRELTGSINAALLLCQLIYWHDKTSSGNGWIFKRAARSRMAFDASGPAWEQHLGQELGLTYTELKNARQQLRSRGFLQERFSRSEHRMYFHLEIANLARAWEQMTTERGRKAAAPRQVSCRGAAGFLPSLKGINREYTENTAERPASSAQPNVAPEDPSQDDPAVPATPVEAMQHPDILLFQQVCERIPAQRDYAVVIHVMRHFRSQKGLKIVEYLRPFCLAWSSRRRRVDGQPYDPASLTWLTEWAINGRIPPESGGRYDVIPDKTGHEVTRLTEGDRQAAGRINARRQREHRVRNMQRNGLV